MVFCLPPATSAAAGEGALQAEPCCLEAEATCSGTPTPGPGWDWCLQRCVASGPQKVVSCVGSKSGAVGLRQQCAASKAPASWRTPNASRPRRRRAEAPRRMDCCGLPPLWETSEGGSQPSNGMPSPRVEAGPLGAGATGGPLRARNGGPPGLSAGTPVAEGRSECATVQEWAGPWGGGYELGGSMRVQSSGPASFGLGPWRKLCWVWIPFGATGAGRCCPRAAAPPRGPKTEMCRRSP